MEQPLLNQSSIPILIQQGQQDTSVVPELTRAMAVQACALGNQLTYQEYPNDVHRSVQYTGRSQFIGWLNERFAGDPMTNDCQGW